MQFTFDEKYEPSEQKWIQLLESVHLTGNLLYLNLHKHLCF